MDLEHVYGFLNILLSYTNTKEREQALEEFLNYLYENDVIDINDLYNYIESSEDEESEWSLKLIKRFIKDNDLEDYEEDEDWY